MTEGPAVYVGTYAEAGGAGLHRLVSDGTGGWTLGTAAAQIRNASFGAYSHRRRLAYLVDECEDGAIGVFRQARGEWTEQARATTHGSQPCYVTLDGEETLLAVANYGDGSVALYALDADGLPIGPPTTLLISGGGPNAERQEGPHAHCVCFSRDQSALYHVDLGADRVYRHVISRQSGEFIATTVAYTAPPGSGPRHLVLHPALPFALLVSELASTLTVLQPAKDGGLEPVQTISTLPEDFEGESLGGHLSMNLAGDRVYVTNRGHDSVAVFGLDPGGALKLLQHAPSGGASPRAFALLEAEGQLLLANEEGESLTVFDLADDGTLMWRGRLPLPGAAFVFVT